MHETTHDSEDTDADAAPRVLYIGGAGRSGSTLLEMLLGEVDGFFAAGEVTHLWNRGLHQVQLCGCQRPFSDCPFWASVFDNCPELREQAEALRRLRDEVCRLSRLHALRWPAVRSDDFDEKMRRYGDALVELYGAIHRTTGCEVIIDSSKYPPEALLLDERDDIDLAIVHLVRDSRAVAHSWTRKKVRPEIHWKEELMPRYPPAQTAVAWNVFNLFFERLGAGATPMRTVRYEDLVTEPNEALNTIVEMTGGEPTAMGRTSLHFELSTNHTVSGNPTRFHDGELTLYFDEKWRTEMNPASGLLVSTLTWPLLRRYGYA